MKNVAIIFGSFIWFLLVFRIALGIHFPLETVDQRIRSEVEKRSDQQLQLDVNDLSLSGLIGLSLANSTLYTTNKEGDSSPLLLLDSLSVKLSPLQLLLASVGITLDAELLNGNIQTTAHSSDFTFSSIDFDAQIQDVTLDLLPIVTKDVSVNLGGLLQSTTDLTVDSNKPLKESKGTLNMSIDNFTIQDLNYQGIDAPNLQFSEAKAKLKLNNGKVSVEEATFISESLGLEMSGDIILRKNLWRSTIKLALDITLGDEFKLLARMIPELKNGKVADGEYKLNIIGTLGSPRIKKSRPPTSATKRSTRSTPPASEKEAKPPRNNAASPDEKRKQRRERIKRRNKDRAKRASGGVSRPDMSAAPIMREPLDVEEEEYEESEEENDDGEEENDDGEEENEESEDLSDE